MFIIKKAIKIDKKKEFRGKSFHVVITLFRSHLKFSTMLKENHTRKYVCDLVMHTWNERKEKQN